MLTQKQVKFLREELKTSANPLFYHDGDADGLCAFLLLYRIHREGKSYALTKSSKLDLDSFRKVEELSPDKIFVLDIPILQQEFIDKAKRPIFWIDHHPPLQRTDVHYFNPRIKKPDAYIPTTRMAWQVTQRKQDLWLAAAGCLADYAMPDFLDEFIKEYPEYLKKKEDLPTILFKRPVGKLVKLFFFIQKGPSSEVRKSIKVLTRIKSPDEIFKQETSQGKFIYKRFEKINELYEDLLKEAKKSVTRSKLVLFFYSENKWSFTTNLANELSGLNPKKVILIARRKSGEVKCSLRGKGILFQLQEALEGVEGSGGGHPDACGAIIKEESWDQFVTNLKRAISK